MAGDPEYQQRWREANKERIRETQKAYRAANADALRAKKQAYYRANKDKDKVLTGARGRAPTEREKAQRSARARLKNAKVSPGLFDSLIHSQLHLCAVCQVDLRELPPHRVHADHCHATGKPRGVLCGSCNMALGLLKDNPEILERAASYLRSPTKDWL